MENKRGTFISWTYVAVHTIAVHMYLDIMRIKPTSAYEDM
jgi:hypothetical protein